MKPMIKEYFRRLWMMAVLTAISMAFFSATSYAVAIGNNYGGGIVFFIDSTGQHGLIAAEDDLGELMEWDKAVSACRNYASQGYRDWYLPNKSELHKLYKQKSAVGGFADFYYWSSTESSAVNAWNQYFSSGTQDELYKSNYARVRAVRAF